MRITLNLEDDVAEKLTRLQREQQRPMNDIVNDALRRGLQAMTSSARSRGHFVTQPLEIGQCLVGSIDNFAELLAHGEDERFR